MGAHLIAPEPLTTQWLVQLFEGVPFQPIVSGTPGALSKLSWSPKSTHTVDGQNPAPLGIDEALEIVR